MRNKKKLEEYVAGDVIRAVINHKKVEKGQREHCFIVLNNPRAKSEKKQHILCVPSCSFSSKPTMCSDKKCLNLSSYGLPDEFFNKKKDTSYLRFSEPTCLERYQIKEHITNLKSYPKLWQDICELMNQHYGDEIEMLEDACNCSCLDENEIQVTFCTQDEDFLLAINSKIGDHKNCLVCSCCFSIIESDSFGCDFKLCPNCEDNLYVTYVDNEKGERYEIPRQ